MIVAVRRVTAARNRTRLIGRPVHRSLLLPCTLTGETRHSHHPASEARERALLSGGRPNLIDCSHFASEQLWLTEGARGLEAELAREGFAVQMLLSELNTDPWDFAVRPERHPGSASTNAEAARY